MTKEWLERVILIGYPNTPSSVTINNGRVNSINNNIVIILLLLFRYESKIYL